MPRDRKPLPALDNAPTVTSPDLPPIYNRNYTDTILKYGGLATRFPQLETNAKTIVAAINELYAHPGTGVVPNPLFTGLLATSEGLYLETSDGAMIEVEGGGNIAGTLYSIGIEGDIYTIDSGNGNHRTLTQAEYEALSEAEKNDGTIYFIEDIPAVTLRPEDLRSDNAEIGQLLSYTRYGMWEPTVDVSDLSTGDVLSWKNNTWQGKHLSVNDVATITNPQNGQALVYDSTSHSWKNGTVSSVGELEDLTDVDITTPSNGQVLKYDNGEWINANESTGVAELDDLDDVDISSPSNGQALLYSDGDWVNGNIVTDIPDLSDLPDVSISSATDGQVLKYDNGTWVNADDEGGGTASDITYDNTESGLTADNVQDAIDEVVGDAVTDISDLSDVSISSATSGQILKYDNGVWVNANESTGSTVSVTQIQTTGNKIATITVDSVDTDLYAPTSGGATSLATLSDVTITSATQGQVLTYDGTDWVNANSSGGGGTAATITFDDTDVEFEADDVQEAFEAIVKTLTQSEYNSLSVAEQNNGTIYMITDSPVSYPDLDDLTDVVISSPSNGQILKYNGTNWVNGTGTSSPWIEETGTLTTGQTSITFQNAPITASSTIDVYTDGDVDYDSVSVSGTDITVTFEAQASDLGVMVRIS